MKRLDGHVLDGVTDALGFGVIGLRVEGLGFRV